MPPPRRRQVTAAVAQRRAEVVRLRSAGLTWPEIAAQLGVSPERAGQLFRDALAAVQAPAVEEYRDQLLAEGDEAVQALRRIIADPNESARTRIEALATWCRWSDRLGRLLGVDAPPRKRVEVITLDMLDEEIERLTAENAAGEELERAHRLAIEDGRTR